MPARADHWDRIYTDAVEHSWDQHAAERSSAWLTAPPPPTSVLDVGGGTSPLVGELLDAGVAEVTVLDVSPVALAQAAARLGDRADRVRWITADVTTWEPGRRYDAWHDRAVLHFLTDGRDREAYRERLHAAVVPGGRVVVATFAADGPETCSGLPTARYEADELAAILGLEEVHRERERHTTPWGTGQAFTWLEGRRPS